MRTNFTMLLVDDDNDDLLLLKHAIAEVNPQVIIDVASDGEAAIKYLEKAFRDNSPPSVIVLDLNMPNLNGRETIELISCNPALNSIPIVVFTTSESKSDRQFCENYKVEMITKPFNMKLLYDNARKIIAYFNSNP